MKLKNLIPIFILFVACQNESEIITSKTKTSSTPNSIEILMIYDNPKSCGELFVEKFQNAESKEHLKKIKKIIDKQTPDKGIVSDYYDFHDNTMFSIDNKWLKSLLRKQSKSHYSIKSLNGNYTFVMGENPYTEETKIYSLDSTNQIEDYHLLQESIDTFLADKDRTSYFIVEIPVYFVIFGDKKDEEILIARRIDIRQSWSGKIYTEKD